MPSAPDLVPFGGGDRAQTEMFDNFIENPTVDVVKIERGIDLTDDRLQ